MYRLPKQEIPPNHLLQRQQLKDTVLFDNFNGGGDGAEISTVMLGNIMLERTSISI